MYLEQEQKKYKNQPRFKYKNNISVFHFKQNKIFVRAPTAGVVNVPNAKYLAHLPHQAQK